MTGSKRRTAVGLGRGAALVVEVEDGLEASVAAGPRRRRRSRPAALPGNVANAIAALELLDADGRDQIRAWLRREGWVR